MPGSLSRCVAGLCLALCLAGCLEPGDPLLATRDRTPPTVRETLPGDLERHARTRPLRFVFSEPMDPRSVRPGISFLLGRDQVPLEIEIPPPGPDPAPVAIAQPWEVVALPASGSLEPDSTYTLSFRTILTDTAGNALEREHRVTFFTLP